jgi:hypothetical protein
VNPPSLLLKQTRNETQQCGIDLTAAAAAVPVLNPRREIEKRPMAQEDVVLAVRRRTSSKVRPARPLT